MNVLVIGGEGQLGSEIKRLSNSWKDANFAFTSFENLDITQKKQVDAHINGKDYDFCINCAAYTAVDKAEELPDLAREVNVIGVQNIAQACSANDITLIHISSDYVYHNEVNRPILENDPTTPKGVYASTKLQGDFAAKSYNDKTIVIRTSWVYSMHAHNFVKTMLRLGKEKDELNIVYDQIGTPTHAKDIALAIFEIMKYNTQNEPQYGIFNFSNEGVTSWYDFTLEIFRINKVECKVNPILSKQYPTPAQRPSFSVLDKSKIKKTFQLEIPHWKDSLADCLKLLKKFDNIKV